MARIIVAQADGTEVVIETPEFESVGGDHSILEGELHEGVEVSSDDGHHSEVFPPFDATTFPSQLLWLAITFAALYFLMSRVALPQIGGIIEARRNRIDGDLAEAERLRQKTEQAIASYEEALAEARGKAHAIAEQTREGIKADLDAKRGKVEAELTAKINDAEARIARTKSEALGHVGEIAAETAQAVAAQLLGKPGIAAARDAVAKVSKE